MMKSPIRTIWPLAQQGGTPVRVTTMISQEALDMIAWLASPTSRRGRRKRKTVDLLSEIALFFENRNCIATRIDWIAQILERHDDNTDKISFDWPPDMDLADPLDSLLATASIGPVNEFLLGIQDLIAGRFQTKRKTFLFTQPTVANVGRMQKVFERFLGPVTRSQSKTFELMLRIYYYAERANASVFSDQEYLAALEMEKTLNTLDIQLGDACNKLKQLMDESGVEESVSETGHATLITEEELLARGYNPLRAALANMVTIRYFLDQYSLGWCRTVRRVTEEERAEMSEPV